MKFVHKKTGEIRTITQNELKKTKRLKIRAKILKEAERCALNCFLTLTLNLNKIPFDVCPICFLRIVWDRFLKRMKRMKQKNISFISIIEEGINSFHLHAMIDANIKLKWIRKAWTECGGGYIVSAEIIGLHEEIKNVAAYITKNYVESNITGKLISCSRNIKLQPEKTDSNWEILTEEQVLDTNSITWQNEDDEWFTEVGALCAHGYFIANLIRFIANFKKTIIEETSQTGKPPNEILDYILGNNSPELQI
jgi:hypothetical protein